MTFLDLLAEIVLCDHLELEGAADRKGLGRLDSDNLWLLASIGVGVLIFSMGMTGRGGQWFPYF